MTKKKIIIQICRLKKTSIKRFIELCNMNIADLKKELEGIK